MFKFPRTILTFMFVCLLGGAYFYQAKKSIHYVSNKRIIHSHIQNITQPDIPNSEYQEQIPAQELIESEINAPTQIVELPESVEPSEEKPINNTLTTGLELELVADELELKPASNENNAEETGNTESKKQTIAFTNAILPEMLSYKHWTGTYEPTLFIMQINGSIIQSGETKNITVENNKCTIRYDYAFLKGKRTGAKEIVFTFDSNTTTAAITFNWKNEWHVIIENGTPESITSVSYNPPALS